MDDTIQYDPRTKQQIKDQLYQHLYSPIEKYSKAKINSLILRNSSLMGNSKTAFMYKGAIYSITDHSSYRNANRLHKSLYSDMDEYLKEVTELNTNELPYVIGLITSVLNTSNSLQDYLNLLPSSVHTPIASFIEKCPCKHCQLPPEEVQKFVTSNHKAITLMKKRMLLNLLI